jgi:hypothetical protein
MAIPDYKQLLDPVIDRQLGKLHHRIQTQHQWRFEVMIYELYGCKYINIIVFTSTI